MNLKAILLVATAFLILTPARAQQPASVMTEYGLVEGVTEKDLTVYRGIPFAAPPVGDLRWRPPQPARAWDGVRDAFAQRRDGDVAQSCAAGGMHGLAEGGRGSRQFHSRIIGGRARCRRGYFLEPPSP